MENTVFVDASAYLAILVHNDPHHKKAVQVLNEFNNKQVRYITSYAVLGEVLTVASQRYSKREAIKFVSDIMTHAIQVVHETPAFMKQTFKKFKGISNKNVSWVDCYSFVIIDMLKIKQAFSFDRDFKRFARVDIITI